MFIWTLQDVLGLMALGTVGVLWLMIRREDHKRKK